MLISIDGERTAPAAAQVSVFDRGFLFGDAIYEVVATQDGRLFQFEAHLDRLEESGAAIGLEVRPFRATLVEEVEALVADLKDPGERYVRIMMTRGASPGFDLLAADEVAPLRVVLAKALAPWPAHFYEEGITLKCVRPDEIVARISPSVKSNNRAANVMAHRIAREAGADDALFVDPDGCVSEGPSWNLFGVTGGRIWTAPLVGGILPGITRSTVLRLCAELGIVAEERPVTVQDARGADELFVTSTTRGVMSVARLDEVTLSSERPVTARLSEAWRSLAKAGEE